MDKRIGWHFSDENSNHVAKLLKYFNRNSSLERDDTYDKNDIVERNDSYEGDDTVDRAEGVDGVGPDQMAESVENHFRGDLWS